MVLRVKRSEFANALRIVGRASRGIEDAQAILALANGELIIELAGSNVCIPVEGDWSGEVRLQGSALKKLARSLPEDDPLQLRVENGRFFVSRFSIPCELRTSSRPTPVKELIPSNADPFEIFMIRSRCSDEEIDAAGAASLVAEAERKVDATCRTAAGLLRRYGITPAHLRKLCDEHAAGGKRKFRESDGAAIGQIARAWELLAPLGVEPDELKALMDECLRNAWRNPK